jgi:aryl-alcohol dehydrogenase-like predicted oxidoreductase
VTAPIIGVSTPAQWQGWHEAVAVDWTDSLATQIDELFRLPA